MWKNRYIGYLILWLLGLAASACQKETESPATIDILSIKINGADLKDGAKDIPVNASLEIVFSAELRADLFESALSITSGNGALVGDITYSNQTSRVTIDLDLAYQTTYTLTIASLPIGVSGGALPSASSYSFTTKAEGIINRLPPCTSGNESCLSMLQLSGTGIANFQVYSSFPLDEPEAQWLDLTTAVMVVHGVNRNADDYFNYLMGALQTADLEEQVLLIAPFFKEAAEADADDLYWSGNGWREGQPSAGEAKLSSFAVVDQLIDQLSDKVYYPALERIIITGHSSGALFTHLYAAAGKAAEQHPELTFDYVVANSQYFYYPDGQRVDETTDQLYTPSGCAAYDFWPMGFTVTPPYLSGQNQNAYNERFVGSPVTYLLGNGSGADGAFNQTDCFARLLGSSRYLRGENMFRYMELRYPGLHQHQKVIVDGVGHDGAGMYRSPEFSVLLTELVK